MHERKMSKKEKSKEKRLKKKYDDSDMKASMKKQYGDDWEQVYFATIRKQAMESEGKFDGHDIMSEDPPNGIDFDYANLSKVNWAQYSKKDIETFYSIVDNLNFESGYYNDGDFDDSHFNALKWLEDNVLSKMEGYKILPPINRDRYQERDGLEGPFSTLSGKVVYYDPKQGAYYDPDTDMYLSYDEFKALDNDRTGMKEAEKRWKSTSMSYDDAVAKYGKENVKKGMFKRGTGEDDVQVFVEDSNDAYGGAIDRAVARVLGNARAQQSGAPATSPRPRLRPNNFPTVDLTPDAEAGDQVHIRPTPKPVIRPRLRPQNIGSNPRTGATRGIDPRDNYSPADLQRLLNQPGMRSESNINELEIPGTDYSIPDAAVAAAAAIAPAKEPTAPKPKAGTARRAAKRGMSLVSNRPTAATSAPTANLSTVQSVGKPSWGSRALGALGKLASRASLPAMILAPTQMGDGTLSPEMAAELEREAQRRRSMGEMRESLQFNEDDNHSISDNETVAIYVRTMLDESHNTWDKVKEQVHFVLSVLDENHTADAKSVLALLHNRNLQESIEKQIMLKENIDTLKKIVADKSVMPVKFDDGTMRVDLTTASIFLSVYDKQKPETQEKMQKMMKTKAGFVKLLDVIYSKAQ